MDRAICRALGEALRAMDFSEIEERLNVKISLKGGGSFDPKSDGSATFKIEAFPIVNGTVVPKEEKDFRQMAIAYGLKADDFGRTFMHRGKEFEITGLKTRRPKFPISVKCLCDGKDYKFPETLVKMLLGD